MRRAIFFCGLVEPRGEKTRETKMNKEIRADDLEIRSFGIENVTRLNPPLVSLPADHEDRARARTERSLLLGTRSSTKYGRTDARNTLT